MAILAKENDPNDPKWQVSSQYPVFDFVKAHTLLLLAKALYKYTLYLKQTTRLENLHEQLLEKS